MAIQHSVEAVTLAELLERVLDKGIVIAGDIRIKLADVELLTIQSRLVIASVDKAVEMGMDWWKTNPYYSSLAQKAERQSEVADLERRIAELEGARARTASAPGR